MASAKGKGVQKVEVEDMSHEALFCRSDHHAWNHKNDYDIVTKRGYVIEFKRHCVCARCGADRVQVFEVPSFRVKKSKIIYPEGYLSAGGRVYVAEVRRQQLVRMGLKVHNIDKEKNR